MALKQVELAPKNDEYVVFGYTREAGTKLHMNISTPIKYICLNYYFAEHFAHYENNIEINDTKDTIKNNDTGTILETPAAIACGYIEIDPNLNIFSTIFHHCMAYSNLWDVCSKLQKVWDV
eukprot:71352_1